MSLDVYLTVDSVELNVEIQQDEKSRIFIREDGRLKQISRAEWDDRFPGREPITVSSPFDSREVFSANITHNLSQMAGEAQIYRALWRPEELSVEFAQDLVAPLSEGLSLLQSDPDRFREFIPPNGWGTYEGLVEFVQNYLDACRRWPHARISVSR